MTPLVTIDLGVLTGPQSFLPFDIRSLDASRDSHEGSDLLRRMWKLYEAVAFEFHSPGNSFHRNVLIEVSFQYLVRPSTRLLALLEHDAELTGEYHSVVAGLCAGMSGIKTRVMSEEYLRSLTEFDHERQTLSIVSKRITYVGIEESIKTYANIPDDLLRKLKYG